MKKFLLAAALLLYSNLSLASGPYDGIWEVIPYGYVIISERDNVLIAVININDEFGGLWSALQGQRVNNTARITTIKGVTNAISDIQFDSETTLQITQISCTPISSNYSCLFPDGLTLTANKVW